MDFDKLVAQILSETTELGRAYRQTKSHLYDTFDKDKGHWVKRNLDKLNIDVTGIRNKYKQAQDRANQLEKKICKQGTYNTRYFLGADSGSLQALRSLKSYRISF